MRAELACFVTCEPTSGPQLCLKVTTMNATEPTYFLYSGRLFHDTALPALLEQMRRSTDSAAASSSNPQPRPEDPGPEGPEGEPVGEEDEDEDSDVPTAPERPDEKNTEGKPLPGPGVPLVPEHGTPDANPIDPRVF